METKYDMTCQIECASPVLVFFTKSVSIVFVSILIDTNIQLNQNLKTSTMSSGSSRWYG